MSGQLVGVWCRKQLDSLMKKKTVKIQSVQVVAYSYYYMYHERGGGWVSGTRVLKNMTFPPVEI